MCKNKNEELLPYYEEAKRLLDYNTDTGVFTWKTTGRGRSKTNVAGTINSQGYQKIGISINNIMRRISGHRLAWYIKYEKLPILELDHINLDKSDNRIDNLREATRSEQGRNRTKPSNNTSGYKGVIKQRNKWRAVIYIDGKAKNLGSFECAEEANKVYQAKAKELFGEFYHD